MKVTTLLFLIFTVSVNAQLLNKFKQPPQINKKSKNNYSKKDLVLLDSVWSLKAIKYKDSSKLTKIEKGNIKVYFNKATQQFLGTLDCNHFRGWFMLEDKHLSLNVGTSTAVECLSFPLRGKYIATMLNKTNQYKIENNQLILSGSDSSQLYFIRTNDKKLNINYSKQDLTLVNNSWLLNAIKVKDGAKIEVYEKVRNIISFNKVTQSFFGNLDCNRFSGWFDIKEDKLTLNQGITQLRGCLHFPTIIKKTYHERTKRMIDSSKEDPREIEYRRQNEQIKHILSKVNQYKIEKNQLILSCPDLSELYFSQIIN